MNSTLIKHCLSDLATLVTYLKKLAPLSSGFWKTSLTSNIASISFLFVDPPNSSECAQALQSFRTLAQDINLPIKEEKNGISNHSFDLFMDRN